MKYLIDIQYLTKLIEVYLTTCKIYLNVVYFMIFEYFNFIITVQYSIHHHHHQELTYLRVIRTIMELSNILYPVCIDHNITVVFDLISVISN